MGGKVMKVLEYGKLHGFSEESCQQYTALDKENPQC